MLVSPVEWVLFELGVQFQQITPDYSLLKQNGSDVVSRLSAAIELYEPDLVILHRDSDSRDRQPRVRECEAAIQRLSIECCVICVPVYMSEAWFLFDEQALRTAAGNPNGTIELSLPTPREAERLTNPKQVVEQALLRASEVSGRRLINKRKRIGSCLHRLAELINDYGPLRESESFSAFEESLREKVNHILLYR